MSDGYEDKLRQGRELRAMRSRHAEPGSPCERCKRDACPAVCFPRRDWNKRHESAAGALPKQDWRRRHLFEDEEQ